MWDMMIMGHDPDLSFECDTGFFRDSPYDEILESEDILPRSVCIIDKEVPMTFTDFDSADTSPLESCFIDELPCRDSWRIFEKTST